MKNIISKYANDATVLKQAKAILKKSIHVPAETIEEVKNAYQSLKSKNLPIFLSQLFSTIDESQTAEVISMLEKGVTKAQ